MAYKEILHYLEAHRDSENIAGMMRFGITPAHTYGIRIPMLRKLAKEARPKEKQQQHSLAAQLWTKDTRETRILASLIDTPTLVTEAQMESWASEFDYWEIVDQCCANLFQKTPFAYAKAIEWSQREPEFVKRSGFVLMARLAVADKKALNTAFDPFWPLIVQEAGDSRNLVKKAANWALRQLGKRNLNLNQKAIYIAQKILSQNSPSAQWIANDALRELQSKAVQDRLQKKQQRLQ